MSFTHSISLKSFPRIGKNWQEIFQDYPEVVALVLGLCNFEALIQTKSSCHPPSLSTKLYLGGHLLSHAVTFTALAKANGFYFT